MFFELFSPLTTASSILGVYWWLYTPVVLFFGVFFGRQTYFNQKYLQSLKWVLLEVKPPPDVAKSPKVAEYIFANLHAIYLPVTWKKRFFEGKVHDWYSFEIVSTGGEPHFYIRTIATFQQLVQSQIFAQYPAAEIKLVEEDYVTKLPGFLPNDELNLFGSELLLAKPDPFPIKTYPEFEEENVKDKETAPRTDPLASIFETLSLLEPNEHIWIQILARPTGDVLSKGMKGEIDTLIGREIKVEDNALGKLIGVVDSLVLGGGGAEEAPKKDQKEPTMMNLTPGVRGVIEAMEKKAAKLAYETCIRFIYIGPNDNFHRGHVSAMFGLFKQFSVYNMNSFKPNGNTITAAKGLLHQIFPGEKGFFAAAQEFRRKWKIYLAYKTRKFPKKHMVLNTEELATIFHLPGLGVKAPLFPRVESKKGQPPSGLPTG